MCTDFVILRIKFTNFRYTHDLTMQLHLMTWFLWWWWINLQYFDLNWEPSQSTIQVLTIVLSGARVYQPLSGRQWWPNHCRSMLTSAVTSLHLFTAGTRLQPTSPGNSSTAPHISSFSFTCLVKTLLLWRCKFTFLSSGDHDTMCGRREGRTTSGNRSFPPTSTFNSQHLAVCRMVLGLGLITS